MFDAYTHSFITYLIVSYLRYQKYSSDSVTKGSVPYFKSMDHRHSYCFETFQSFRKRNGGEIHQVCAACGYQGTINMASHKLTTYIAKNPPDAVSYSYQHHFIHILYLLF